MRRLPFDEALTIADSALRDGVPPTTLARIAESARGPGSPQMRRVAHAASALAANPFESGLRSIALDVPGFSVVPQVTIREPDFVRRILVAAVALAERMREVDRPVVPAA
jgi:hypothetical protein